MTRAYHLALGEPERLPLEQLRDHGPKAYLRERSATLPTIAKGSSIRRAALQAGLKPHDADTVCAWVLEWRAMSIRGQAQRAPAAPACSAGPGLLGRH